MEVRKSACQTRSDKVERSSRMEVRTTSVSPTHPSQLHGPTDLFNLSGFNSRSSTSNPFKISPLKLGISTPLYISVGLLLGFAYCPAILAILTTGLFPPQISTRLICS